MISPQIAKELEALKRRLPPGYGKKIKNILGKGYNIYFVYNVMDGKISSTESIRKVIIAAKRVIDEYEKEQKDLLTLIEK